jgi:hypothetical protein
MPDSNHPHPHFPELTPAQWAYLAALTDQRITNSLEAADFISDLSKEAKDFLQNSKPATLTFFKDLRPDEVQELGNAIENARALRRGGRLLRWGTLTLFGAFVGMTVIWDKVSAWFKVAK